MSADPFRIRSHVAEFDALSRDFAQRSVHARKRWRTSLNQPYGNDPSERLDLYFPESNGGDCPIHIFLHGGYWRANRKDDYGFVADTICRAGGVAAVVGYSLMPRARMEQLVDQVRRAAGWLHEHARAIGGDAGRISASGHSAGAHLAFYLAAAGSHERNLPHYPVRSLLLVSGVYQLAPISRSFLQAELALTQDEVGCWSPCDGWVDSQFGVTIVAGGDETSPFLVQADDLAERLSSLGVGAERVTIAGLNHMTIMRQLGCPGTPTAALLVRTIEQLSIHDQQSEVSR